MDSEEITSLVEFAISLIPPDERDEGTRWLLATIKDDRRLDWVDCGGVHRWDVVEDWRYGPIALFCPDCGERRDVQR